MTHLRNAPIVHSILFCITAHQSSPSWASFLLSREWQFGPSRSESLISSCCYHDNSMCYIKTRSLCFTICSAWHHYHPAQPLTAAFLWVSPIPGLFCPLYSSILSSLRLFWQKSKGQSVIPPAQPLGKVTFKQKQSTAAVCMCMHAHYGHVQGVSDSTLAYFVPFVLSCDTFWDILIEQE